MRTVQMSLAVAVVSFSLLAATEVAAQNYLQGNASAADVKRALMQTRGIRRPAAPSPADAIPRTSGQPIKADHLAAPPAHRRPPPSQTHAAAKPQPPAKPASATPAPTAPDDGQGQPADFQILFDRDSAELRPQARKFLDTIAAQLNSSDLSGDAFSIEGHTDGIGGDDYNLALSQRRAQAVRGYLIEQRGVDPQRLDAVGKGKSELADPSAPGSAINRRVRFVNRSAG